MSTAEIDIRRYGRNDVDALYAAARESVEEVSRWLPWCHPDYSREEAQEWIRSRDDLFGRGTEYSFGIFEGGRLVGGCGLNHIHPLHRFANLGYWVRTTETGRGVATAAVGRLARFAFTETDLIRLEIVCAVDNRASQRVAVKAGAVREALLRDRLLQHGKACDAVVFTILRSTWSGRSGG